MDVFERKAQTNKIEYPYDSVEQLFTLRRDDYYQENFFVTFVNVDPNPVEFRTWRLIFNRRHEGISVYDLPSGTEIYKNLAVGEFLGKVDHIEIMDKFWFAHSWVWGSHQTPCVIDVYAMAKDGKKYGCHIHFVGSLNSTEDEDYFDKCDHLTDNLEDYRMSHALLGDNGRYDVFFELRNKLLNPIPSSDVADVIANTNLN